MRRKRVVPARLWWVLSVAALAISAVWAKEPPLRYENGRVSIPFGAAHSYEDIAVKRVVDGDTLQLASGERVRLIGIDTPEMHHSKKLERDSKRSGEDAAAIQEMGRRAYAYSRALLEGKRVRLEFDVERTDRYERLLAYVYLKDGTMANEEIIRQGYASLMTIPPNVKYVERFKEAYRQAREEKRGLWKE